ncbi:prolipoprotein diacylglyceryl transferase [Micropruina sp. KQZ13P-5]|nr:prolipoprotein diacylglyceryl transferase [Micropruina sp. KQZ13P-5]MCW3157594.1 prolipoprotein diacylglyceryl transferase [Micropruina sp. KQZ13P-5]
MLLSIPSPPISGWQIGPFYLHIYALCLIAGMIAAWTIGSRRWRARGGGAEQFETIVLVAIPVGIVGARIYHVLTHWGDYFAPGIDPWSALRIWEGGIAIYGAIGAGALAAWLMCRRFGVRFSSLADSLAPGIAVGQALGRFGNWFNQELYGLPTDLPWALEIDPAHRVAGFEQYSTFHPTFAYESLWNVLVALTLIWADRRFRLGRGKVFALYIALYGFGRFFTEGIRLDFSYDTFGPIRFNQAVAALICLVGVALLIWLVRNRPGREPSVNLSVGDAALADQPDADDDTEVASDDQDATPDEQDASSDEPEAQQDAAFNDGDRVATGSIGTPDPEAPSTDAPESERPH